MKTESMNDLKTGANALETFRVLYPIFKEEVYRRRQVMGKITRLGVLCFLLMSIFVAFFDSEAEIKWIIKIGLVGGVVISLFVMLFQVIQEKSRHEQAKLQLITLEEGLKFFDSGAYLPGQSLYPDIWKNRPKIDTGLAFSMFCLSGAALVLILTILS